MFKNRTLNMNMTWTKKETKIMLPNIGNKLNWVHCCKEANFFFKFRNSCWNNPVFSFLGRSQFLFFSLSFSFDFICLAKVIYLIRGKINFQWKANLLKNHPNWSIADSSDGRVGDSKGLWFKPPKVHHWELEIIQPCN